MPVTAKPTSYSVGAATLRPNHLWMFDEGSGTTLTDQGSTGGKDLTIVGADWDTDGTHGPILSFVAANSDYAHRTETGSEPVLGITTGFTVAVLVRVASVPAASQQFVAVQDSGAINVYYTGGLNTAGTGRQEWTVRNTTHYSNGITGNDLGDDTWHWVVFTFGDSTQSATRDGSGYGSGGQAANIADSLIDRFSVGAKVNTSPNYCDCKIGAVAVWVNTILNSTQQSDLWNGGDVWTAMGVTVSSAPTFDTAPTVTSQTATAYTLTYDADANATDIYVGIYLKDATAPTAAQIKAGTNAHGTATEATTGSSDTITVTASESPAFPIYDVYAVLEGAGGFSDVVALVDEALDPASGKQHVTIDVPWGASEDSILDGASPAAVDGDIIVCDSHVDSYQAGADAYALTMYADGVPEVDPGVDTSRLSFTARFYDVSTGGWSDASPVTYYINNVPPDWTHETSTFLYEKDEAIDTLALESKFTHDFGDPLTVTLQDSLPAGLSFGSEQITGTPTAYGRTVVTVRAQDLTGEYTDHDITIEVGDVLPDVTGIGRSSAEGVIGAFMSCTTQVVEAVNAAAAGQVYGQEPEAGTLVPHDQLVTLLVSLGASAQQSGGMSFFDAFERERHRREKKRREEDEAEELAAELAAVQVAPIDEIEDSDLGRLQALAERYAVRDGAERYGEVLARAIEAAASEGTREAIERMVRAVNKRRALEAFAMRAALAAIDLNG